MALATLVPILVVLVLTAFAAGYVLARRRHAAPQVAVEDLREREGEREPETEAVAFVGDRFVRFEHVAARGTTSTVLDDHADEWRAAMREVGEQLRGADVAAAVFAHGSFVGTDPLSALSVVGTSPARRALTKAFGRKTRAYVDRLLGDLGNFGSSYVRLFEQAIGGAIPCTTFVWSSENHHVGRLEGALGLVRVLATHAELSAPEKRILVVGHSHAGQVFALVTQLLSRSLASEAILDVARARSLDVSSLEVDLRSLSRCGLDFVTFGAPTRYAWAKVSNVRSLHVVHRRESPETPRQRLSGADWVRHFGSGSSDFPAFASNERRLNATLESALAVPPVALTESNLDDHPHGELVFVDYGGERLASLVSSGLGHGVYTRLDAMLFNASLVATRLYRPSP